MKNWFSSGGWLLPGGGLKNGEVAADGAARELREETGIQIAPGALLYLGSSHYRQYGLSYTFQSFAAKVDTDPVLRKQSVIAAELCWIDPGLLTSRTAGRELLTSLELLKDKHPDFLIQ
jgi:ADP-ribose pyrophosphatase YjhB (NUDIX family)